MTGMNEKMEIKCLPSFKFSQASLLQSSESCQRIQALKWLWYPPFYTPHCTHIHTIYNFKKQNLRNSNKIPIFSFLLTDGPLCCYSDVVPDLPVGHPGLLLALQCLAELFVSCSALEALPKASPCSQPGLSTSTKEVIFSKQAIWREFNKELFTKLRARFRMVTLYLAMH